MGVNLLNLPDSKRLKDLQYKVCAYKHTGYQKATF